MKIVKIGTFNKFGTPINWELACENPQNVSDAGYILGVIDEKVFVCGVEVVEWTNDRLEIMQAGI